MDAVFAIASLGAVLALPLIMIGNNVWLRRQHKRHRAAFAQEIERLKQEYAKLLQIAKNIETERDDLLRKRGEMFNEHRATVDELHERIAEAEAKRDEAERRAKRRGLHPNA